MAEVLQEKQAIQVTDLAKIKLSELANSAQGKFVRLAVGPGGCQGFSVQLFLDNEEADDDFKIFDNDKHILSVDSSSISHIPDTIVDFIENFAGGRFQIRNLKGQPCGCGNSFSGAA